jgi:hypothetical protein
MACGSKTTEKSRIRRSIADEELDFIINYDILNTTWLG